MRRPAITKPAQQPTPCPEDDRLHTTSHPAGGPRVSVCAEKPACRHMRSTHLCFCTAAAAPVPAPAAPAATASVQNRRMATHATLVSQQPHARPSPKGQCDISNSAGGGSGLQVAQAQQAYIRMQSRRADASCDASHAHVRPQRTGALKGTFVLYYACNQLCTSPAASCSVPCPMAAPGVAWHVSGQQTRYSPAQQHPGTQPSPEGLSSRQ